jgi:pantoate--beta-alanine ligase
MGALHEGHLALIKKARSLVKIGFAPGTLVVSLFVNPTQFGPGEDLANYPRTFEKDAALCREAGVDFLFAPKLETMYAPDASVWVDETTLSRTLCGASRPGHFKGVCTVVSKLFNITRAEYAIFGKKDAQQLAIIRRMVRDLSIPIKIFAVDTVREPDGLALSSRNRYLSAEERGQALILSAALRQAAAEAAALPRPASASAWSTLELSVRQMIETAPLAKVDYVRAVDAETLAPPSATTSAVLLAVAVSFGKTRLIDNVEVTL